MMDRVAFKKIESRNNPTFKKFLKMTRGRGIRKYGLAFLSGIKQVREVLRDFPEQCTGVLFSRSHVLRDPLYLGDIPVYQLEPDLFQEIDISGTGQPILMVRAGPFPLWEDRDWPKGCSLFIPFQDPANVGAAIRSAAAFGVSGVIMLKEAAHPFHHRSVRVAGSCLFRTAIYDGPSIREMDKLSVPLITLSPKGSDISRYRFPGRFGLLPGLEGPGLPENLRQTDSVAIPMEAGIESVNAAMATGIILYLWRSRLRPIKKAPGPRKK
jgi:tRNA G18 (ribose-2'-O)-methylase SpoU